MKKKLQITLKSDICVASGFSYAGLLDKDVCYDKWGFPYIPARRFKGCLKDTAEQLLYSFISKEDIDYLFGVKGNPSGGNLKITNARLENYENLVREIAHLRESLDGRDLFSQQQVIDQYTHTVGHGSSKIEKDGSINYISRQVRVVNHFSPADEVEEQVFVATIEFDDEYVDIVNMMVLGTKNIGHRRNRGLGAVACKLLDYESYVNPIHASNISDLLQAEYDEDKQYIIRYILRNDEPLMICGKNDTRSEKYINGQNMLGYVASKYLKENGNEAAQSETFADLFLNGTTKFVAAYPTEIADNGAINVFYPAPLYVNQFKKTENYINVLFPIPEHEDIPGNQPKKLKEQFIHKFSKTSEIKIKEVDMKLHFHRKRFREEDGVTLTSSNAIESGQVFAGDIYTSGKYVKTIIELLDNSDVFVGRSKSAQYGHCGCQIWPQVFEYPEIKKYSGDIVVTLLTDSVFADSSDYTVETNTIANLIADKYSIKAENFSSMVETTLRMGYQSTWNMHKPLIPVIKAGSAFIFRNCEDIILPDFLWIGEKNQEGYGYASVDLLTNMDVTPVIKTDIKSSLAENKTEDLRGLAYKIISAALLESLIETRPILLNFSGGSQLNRTYTMLTQSVDFADFKKRIEAIKSSSLRKMAINRMIKPLDDNGIVTVKHILSDGSDKEGECERLYSKLIDLGYTDEKISSDIWRDYFEYYLIIARYKSKEVQGGKNTLQTDF